MGEESRVGKALDSGLVSRYSSDWCDVRGFSGLGDKMTGTAGERRRLFLPSLYWLCHPWRQLVPSEMCVCVWGHSPQLCCTQKCILSICDNKGGREETRHDGNEWNWWKWATSFPRWRRFCPDGLVAVAQF